MITTGFDTKVKVQQILENQLPEFILDESPKAVDFLKQYYIGQEFQGGVVDITDNLDQYLKLDNLTPEVIGAGTSLSAGITLGDTTVNVVSTKGFPNQYGLFKINDEIVTYTGITTNSFTGCVRGFSGITSYRAPNEPNELVFSTSSVATHNSGDVVQNLSSLFLKEFYKKLKFNLTPGLEDTDFVSTLDVSNFIKQSKSLYQAKGTEESFRILFNVLYGVDPKIVDLENFLLKPSSAQFLRREIILTERISGDPNNLVGQTIKKSNDEDTQASVSEVEIFTRGKETYYKLGLFVGYNDTDLIQGTFSVPGKTKVIGNVSAGSSVITVDSTVGFGTAGVVISGLSTEIAYTDKTVNQFLNCTNIISPISSTDTLRSDENIYGYENGDLSKKVELRITGVLSKFVPISDIKLAKEGEVITVKNVGENILNPETGKTLKEYFFNSWIYNTASRFQIREISGSSFTLYSDIDKSSLKVADSVDVLFRNEENVAVSNAVVQTINPLTKLVTLGNLTGFTPIAGKDYDLRRNINKASSTVSEVQFGNNILSSDIQNVYNDSDKDFYVAANSLPSYDITEPVSKAVLPEATTQGNYIQGYDPNTLKYSILSFNSDVPFITGDEIYYTYETTPIPGLETGLYYVKVLDPNKNQIKIYKSRSFIITDAYIEFDALSPGTGTHTFALSIHKDKKIGAQKLLKKFPVETNVASGDGIKTKPGATGILINGVEITNYKSDDRIFYGPIERLDLVNRGTNYDVINPPDLQISAPGIGTQALVRPVINGNLVEVQVDPQDFDIERVLSATIHGGNGNGAIVQAQTPKRYREISFDARLSTNSGGIDVSLDRLTFTKQHYLKNGQALIYNKNGNDAAVGISTNTTNSANQNLFLVEGAKYYPEVVGLNTVRLYQRENDYLAGINTVGFTTTSGVGIHKFRLAAGKNTLSSIKVIESGSGYQNRKLIVEPVGVNTSDSTINFDNHGFNHGDKIIYSTTGTAIGVAYTSIDAPSGLVESTGVTNTANHYCVIKLDDNSFRLADAGIGGTITSNYSRGNYLNFANVGSGYHNFEYPPIELTLNVEYSGISTADSRTNTVSPGTITATPVVRGSISDVYVYETGTGYGSTIINFEKKPTLSIKTGKNAQLKPIVTNTTTGIGTTSGEITNIEIQTGGSEYTSAPDLEVVGDGIGAILRAVVTNGSITDVKILKPGINYTQDKTSIKITAAGLNASLEPYVRGLSINHYSRFGNDILQESGDNLKYSVVGYSTQIGSDYFGDNTVDHSPIIGWAYDGNPIYGPYGYVDPSDSNSGIKILETGYTDNSSSIVSRPPFDTGFFVEDYIFDSSGDLDANNGRFCKTPEYPDGRYAYFVGINTSVVNGVLSPRFPYFIGDKYRSNPVEENFIIDQNNFNFNESNLIRNTFPYQVSEVNADNDFIVESNEAIEQISIIESITKGSIDSFQIVEPGSEYKVGESLTFDNTGTQGGGLSATINTLTGKEIKSIETTIDTYENAVMVWRSPTEIDAYISTSHIFNNGDNVVISGLTTAIKSLTNSHTIGINTDRTVVFKEIASNGTAGIITDIYVSSIPDVVSVGSSIGIGTERLLVLNRFDDRHILRVRRGLSGAAHTVSTLVDSIPSYLTVPVESPYFESEVNDIVYFNAKESVGVGTNVGIGTTVFYTLGDINKLVSIPSQSIYLPNHPFKTNQAVTFTRRTTALTVANTPELAVGGSTFSLPSSATQTVYIINKSKDYIGLTTQVGLTTTTDGLFYVSGGADQFDYSLESNFNQVTGRVQRINAKVSVSTAHNLIDTDIVDLSVNPGQSVGIGTSTHVRVSYASTIGKLLVNPVGFNSTGINTSTNIFNIDDHGFETGDKVYYSAENLVTSGLQTGSYYVYRVDNNNLQLGETRLDVVTYPPTIPRVISVGSTLPHYDHAGGAKQSLSLINPQLQVIKNNDLVIGVDDASLEGYEFKLFYDSNFSNEFVSTGKTDTFVVSGVGTVGVGTTSTLTLKYSEDNPMNIFYSIEKSGFISTSDTDVTNYSNITYIGSKYSGKYPVFGVGTTTFNIALREVPEVLSYVPTDADTLKYSTNSPTARGGVDSILIGFGGFNYKKLPSFVSIASTQGTNAKILPKSKDINRISDVRIVDPGYEYASDKTLRPEAFVSPVVSTINSDTIDSIDVTYGGKNYTSTPQLVIIDPETGEKNNTGIIEAVLNGTSISEVNIIEPPQGLTPVEQTIASVDNTNGVTIKSITGPQSSSQSGIVTCVLVTPILGFTTATAPFAAGDKVFVEGIQKDGAFGDGFNSEDHKYGFFNVDIYRNTNPAEVVFTLAGLTTNPGVAKTSQNSYATIVNYNSYPRFKTLQSSALFQEGEKLLVYKNNQWSIVDLFASEIEIDSIKTTGSYRISADEKIRGSISGTEATVNSVINNRARFDTNYSLRKDKGWSDDIGKLNEDYQVLPDNDYYQNLSYTVKSPIGYEELVNPVNRLLHTSGLKNFADTGITSTTIAGVGTNTNATNIIRDLTEEKRVDTINNYDFAIDDDVFDNRSKFINFKNIKLSDYVECKTNRVLTIDDISPSFSDSYTSQQGYTEIIVNDEYSRFLVQIRDPNNNNTQVTELISVGDTEDSFVLQKANLFNTTKELGAVSGTANGNVYTLRFTPEDTATGDYDLKIVRTNFNNDLAGIGTQSVGFVDLTGANTLVNAGSTSEIIADAIGSIDAYFASVEVTDVSTQDKNLVEIYVTHDGTNSYFSEYYSDTKSEENFSSNFIGTFTSKIESNVLSLSYENDTSNQILVRSNIVGFGKTSVGISTYRFKKSGQSDGTERSLRMQSSYYNVANANPSSNYSQKVGISSSNVTAVKSIVRVSSASTSAIHQLLTLHDGNDVYLTQYPILSIGHTGGMGSFTPGYDSGELVINFSPDTDLSGQDIQIQKFDEVVYTTSDTLNTPPDLTYGSISQSLSLAQYNGTSGSRINKTNFNLTHDGIPIFEKVFDPSDTAVLNAATGEFTINDHFFNTGERLLYTPNSTFTGIAGTALSINASATEITGGVGIGTTTVLPVDVYAIRINKDKFKIATTPQYAAAGTAVTMTGTGSGNAHEFEMHKKLEKSLLAIDNIIQSPISYTPLNTTLANNGAQISSSTTILGVAGITSITSDDILRIGDEYMKVTNVGLGTTTIGPISGFGSLGLLEVERGFVGSAASTHTNGAAIRIYAGSYNIIGNTIHFTNPPTGNTQISRDTSNLLTPRSSFNGRVFLRGDYSDNAVYDDVSNSFTGIGQTFRVSIAGINTTGIGTNASQSTTGIQTGSGIVLINGMFQKPLTSNNVGHNYEWSQKAGISSISFTGITSTNGQIIKNDYDVNMNQLPRGGMIVSLGSTGGLGVAPLVGAAVSFALNGFGGISTVGLGTTAWGYKNHGSGYRGTSVAIGVTDEAYAHRFIPSPNLVSVIKQTVGDQPANNRATDATYDSETGMLTLTLGSPLNLEAGHVVRIPPNSLKFTCSRDNHATVHTYPRSTDPAGNNTNITVVSVTDTTFTVGVGTGGGKGTGAVVTANVGAGGTLTGFVIGAAGTNYVNAHLSAPDPSYEDLSVTGVSRLGIGATTVTGIGLSVSVSVGPFGGDINYWHGYGNKWSGNKFIDAADLVEKNKLFIGDVAARRMKDRFTSYSYPGGFTEQDCIDDIVDVLEAIAYNLRYGGNDRTIDAAKLYLHHSLGGTYASPGVAPPVEGEEEQVIYAFKEASAMAIQAMRNDKISKQAGAQYAHTFVSATPGSLYMKNDAGVGIGTTTPSTATYDAGTGDLVLTVPSNIHRVVGPTSHTISTCTYTPSSGICTVTINNHGFDNGDWVRLVDDSLIFTCAKDGHTTKHTYPRISDPARGTWLQVSNKTTNMFRINVGISPDGSEHRLVSAIANGLQKAENVIGIATSGLTFKCTRDNNGSNHAYPRTTDPFHNVNVAVASTTKTGSNDIITVNVGVSDTALTTKTQTFDNTITPDLGTPVCANVSSAIDTLVGIVTVAIGSSTVPARQVSDLELTTVNSFKITRPGFGFNVGDVFTPVGLVTDRSISNIRDDFELTVLSVFRDKFSAWNFGEFDYIDSVQALQDGRRTRFPLKYNGELLSFEIDTTDPDSLLIDLQSSLLIFINGVLQEPGEAYEFEGGTTFTFRIAPNAEDNVSIFFYKGSSADSNAVTNITPSIESGDFVQINKVGVTTGQDIRTVYTVNSSDSVETNLYSGEGIDEYNYKPLSFTKQKVDTFINGEPIYKTRNSLLSQVYPTANIIRDFSTTDTQLFVDDISLFKYAQNDPNTSITIADFGALIVEGITPVAAGVTAIVSAGGTISSLVINSGGSGYIGATTSISISAPSAIGVGVGTTATATATVSAAGTISAATIVNQGFGYTNPPQVLTILPTGITEEVPAITTVQGFSGIITGITTSVGIGTILALEFKLQSGIAYADLAAGYPVYVSDTTIGVACSSIYTKNTAIVGVGTTFFDNVYNVSSWDSNAGIITCNIDDRSAHVGMGTTGTVPVGKVSWGRLSGITRDTSPVAIAVTGFTVGLGSFPTIQRRSEGLRSIGAIREHLGA